MQRPGSQGGRQTIVNDRWINIAICLDARMLDAAIVLAASIKAHARPERPVRVYALTDFVAADLATLAAKMNNPRFELVPLACTNVHANFPIRDHITAGTYLRFLLPDLLPDVDKIIYLDVDVVVHRNLEALYDIPLEGTALAAMPDWPMIVGSRTWPTFFVPFGGERLRFAAYVRKVLGLELIGTTTYFNCGVMIFDLAFWRAHDVAGRTVRYLTEHPKLYYMDQDALNYIVSGRYVRLDQRWNSFANCSFPAIINVLVRFTKIGRRWEGLRAIWRRDPWVIHYAGANKPWTPHEPTTPRDALWWHYAALSPMRDRVLAAYAAKETPKQRRRSKVPAELRGATGVA